MNAVQGAKIAGAKHVIAVDPVEFKREKAMELGATHTAASMAEAVPLVTDLTMGQMADRVVMTPGVLYGDMIVEGMALTGKGGTCVATAIAPMTQVDVKLTALSTLEMTLSLGWARAWEQGARPRDETMLSVKILR